MLHMKAQVQYGCIIRAQHIRCTFGSLSWNGDEHYTEHVTHICLRADAL